MEQENKDTGLPEADKSTREIDIDAILLPKKEAPPSTQRINAGVLLEQEQSATLLKPPTSAEIASKKSSGLLPPAGQTFSHQLPPSLSIAGKEVFAESEVPSLQTYRDDIQKLLKKDNVSAITIAAAEAGRRQEGGGGLAQETKPELSPKKMGLIAGGVLLLLGAGGLLVYLFAPPRSVPIADTLPAPFISVDATAVVPVGAAQARDDTMATLEAAKTKISLSLGLVGRLLPATQAPGAKAPGALDAQTFLSILAPGIPPNLLRSVTPTFVLGVHNFDQKQAFLILKVDSYEQAYSGMLQWEGSVHQDLAPLFDYTPRRHIPEENLPSTSSGQVATTTPAQQNPANTSDFVDRIVANHDARVLQNNAGDIYFLWTFLDRNTLVITTNQNTLVEIITRAKVTPPAGM